MIINLIGQGIINALQPFHLMLSILGVTGGIIVGALPGLTATMATALLVPLTFFMNPSAGLVLLGAVWCGGVYGGANAAILLNVPGTPASFATTLDGHPLTRQGDADKALLTSLICSVIGGIFGVIILMSIFAPLARISVKFGKPEYFWLCVFGLTAIASLSSENLLKGIIGGTIGLLLGTIGLDPVTGMPRFTFGYQPLIQGVELIPALIGVFAFSQMLTFLDQETSYIAEYKETPGLIRTVTSYIFKKCKINLLRSSLIGTFIGILPGAGASIASLISYNEGKRWDKNSDQFGKGALEGLVSTETANNAIIGGACVPMLGLGIPGAPVAAVIMGGLLAHGIVPGAKLLEESANIAYDFMGALFIANIVMLIIGYFLFRMMVHILKVPTNYIVPTVLILSTVGAYAMRNSFLDVVIMIIMGILGYFLIKVGVSPAPIALGLILGPIAESALGVSLTIAKAKGSIFQVLIFKPLCLLFIALSLISLLTPLFLSKLEVTKDE